MKGSSRLAILSLLAIGCGGTTPAVETRATDTERFHRILLDDGTDPNGLAWDESRRTLFVADDDAARVLVIINGVVCQRLPLGDEGNPGAGGLVRLFDGSVAAVRYGMDDDGGITRLLADEAVRPIEHLDRARHRLGIDAWGGDLYVGWYTGGHDAYTGGVERVSVSSGEETEVLRELGKVAGVAISGDLLYAADQSHDAIVRCALPDCATRERIAELPRPDLMTAAPDGVFVSSGAGSVHAISSTGVVTLLADDLGGEPRGLAFDEGSRRLFVAVHDPATAHPRHAIVIVPLPEPEAPAEAADADAGTTP